MHDTFTRTVEGAAAAEYLRSGGGYVDDDRPRLSETDRIHHDDRLTPSEHAMRTAAAALDLGLAQRAIFDQRVTISRPGVLAVVPDDRASTEPNRVVEQIEAVYANGEADVMLRDGVVWVRIVRAPYAASPFVVDGNAVDDPPYL